MATPLEQIVSRLADSGLLTAADTRAFVETLPVGKQPLDAEQFLRALVREQRLTTWQARQIGAGHWQGMVLGNYIILEKLGQGGMGEVFKAQHMRMQRVVALKLLSPRVTNNPEALKRFQREAVAAARLVHPNIVTAYDADEAKGMHFLIMEHVAGQNLARLVKETGALSVAQALRCVLQAARGLEYAHRQGVVHRDVKPSNLLLDASGVVKVLDLGLAGLDFVDGASHDLTSTGEILGTVDFMAPEQAENSRSADARSDVYSLGMSLWFLLTGRPGYERDTVASKILAHRTAPIPSLREARPEVSRVLDDVFQRLVAKDPRERYQTMTQAIAALEGCLVDAGVANQADSDNNELAARLSSISRRDADETVIVVKPLAESTLRLHALESTVQLQPAGQPTERGSGERSRRPLTIALAFLAGAALILLTVFLLAPFRGDNVLIEVTDPEVTVVIDNGAIKIVGATRQKLSLSAGEHDLAVKRGETELSETFTVAQGKPTTLEIEVVDGFLKVRQDDKVLGQVALAKPQSAVPVLPEGNFVLEFAPGSKVEVGSLQLDRNGELTLEAFVTAAEGAEGKPGLLLGKPKQFALHLDPQTHALSLESRHDDGEHRIGPLEIPTGRRIHMAAVRTANEHRLYVEGILVGLEKTESPLVEADEPFTIGGEFAGSLEKVRVSTLARYEKHFTPAERFAADDSTVALFQASNGENDRLVDLSGNQHHGTISGAKWVRTEPIETKASIVTPENLGLLFDTDGSRVEIPDFPYDGHAAMTIEARVRLVGPGQGHIVLLNGGEAQYALFRTPDLGIVVNTPTSSKASFTRYEMTDRFVHIAATVDGESQAFFLDGRQVSQSKDSGHPYSKQATTLLRMGVDWNQATINAVLDEVRISKVVRYKEDFAPDIRFNSDAETLALYHFDEGSGDELKDSSGKGLHGKVVGAKWVRATSEGTWHAWPAGTPPPAIAPFDAEQAKQHQQAWAKHLGLPVEYTNSNGMKFRLIPPGEFMMGSTAAEIDAALLVAGEDRNWKEHVPSEGPQHKVILSQPLYLGVYEVTQSQYERIMGRNPSYYATNGPGKNAVIGLDTSVHPVEMASWNDVAEFCTKLSEQEQLKPFYVRDGQTVKMLEGAGYRLPTEAEWEFSCRAGTTTKYWTGDKDEDLPAAGWFNVNSGNRTHAVGELKANPFGLFDVHGNVWELVQDSWEPTYYGQFQDKPALNPSGPSPSGSRQVYRGGNWYGPATGCRAAYRNTTGPAPRYRNIGFRVALTVDAVRQSLKFTGTAMPQPTAADPERRVGEWVLAAGGSLLVQAGDKTTNVYETGDLPSGKFEIRTISFGTRKTLARFDDLWKQCEPLLALTGFQFTAQPLTDDDLDRLTRQPWAQRIVRLRLEATQVTDAGLAHLPRLKELAIFQIGGPEGTPITDVGLSHVASIPTLQGLTLIGTMITDQGLAVLGKLDMSQLGLLHNPKLSFAGMEHLTRMTNLKVLRLDGIPIGDEGLAKLRDLTGLEELNLYGSQVSDEGLETIAPFRKLRSLDMGSPTVKESALITNAGLAKLKDLTDLITLRLSGQKITDEGLVHFKNMTQLQELRLDSTDVADAALPQLVGFTKLTDLRVARSKMTAEGVKKLAAALPQCRIEWDGGVIEPMGSLAPLTAKQRKALEWVLSVGGSVWTSPTVQVFANGLPRGPCLIRDVILQGNKTLDDKTMVNLKDLPPMCGSLDLNYTLLTDAGFATLTTYPVAATVRTLSLPKGVTDAGLAHLKSFPQLTGVYSLSGTDAAIQHLKPLTNLRLLWISDQVTDAGLADLAALQLENLSLAYNQRVTDAGCKHLAGMTTLRVLSLQATGVADGGIKHVTELTNLESLNLMDTQMTTDAGLETVTGFRKLTHLDIRGTKATRAGVEKLAAALPQCKIVSNHGTFEPKPAAVE